MGLGLGFCVEPAQFVLSDQTHLLTSPTRWFWSESDVQEDDLGIKFFSFPFLSLFLFYQAGIFLFGFLLSLGRIFSSFAFLFFFFLEFIFSFSYFD